MRGTMMRLSSLAMAAAAALGLAQAVESQVLLAAPPTYADLADLALTAPVAAHVRVRKADALSDREAIGVPAGLRRLLIEADIVALIRGAGGLPSRVSYLVDMPANARGRAPRIRRGAEYLVLATPVPGRPGELRLVARDGQFAYSAEAAATLRTMLRESAAANAPPRISGIGRAFHVRGSLPGESETQFFLQTADNRPISLSVLRRPGEQPRWSAALGEMVDEAAQTPQRDTLLWYRLACTLPPALPAQSLSEAAPEEAQAIRADYRLVIEALGPCTRNRRR